MEPLIFIVNISLFLSHRFSPSFCVLLFPSSSLSPLHTCEKKDNTKDNEAIKGTSRVH